MSIFTFMMSDNRHCCCCVTSVVPDSVRTRRRQPARLLCPWDSPGKKTGVGCHFLLQFMEVKSESEVTQLCLTLRDPMECSLPSPSIHGISQARIPEWIAIAFSTIFKTSSKYISGHFILCLMPFNICQE